MSRLDGVLLEMAKTVFALLYERGVWCESCKKSHQLKDVRFEPGEDKMGWRAFCKKSGVLVTEGGVMF